MIMDRIEMESGFGVNLKASQFQLHKTNITRLNNGSFGSCPDYVLKAQHDLQQKWYENPGMTEYFRSKLLYPDNELPSDDFWYTLDDKFKASRDAVASLMGSDRSQADNIFIVENLTVAFASVAYGTIANIADSNVVIVVSNFTYPAVYKAIRHCCSIVSNRAVEHLITVEVVDIPFPILDGDKANDIILSAYRNTLSRLSSSKKRIAMALLDHISSLPTMIMPVKEIVALCREHGVEEVVVDGAHAPGQLNLEVVPSLGADYYMANLHKWCFAPTAAAFLWISPTTPLRNTLHHPIISHNYGMGLFAECAMLGTKDYSAMLAVPAAVAFLESIGGVEVVARRNHELCVQAMHMLGKAWGTTDYILPKNLCGSMGMVGCPRELGDSWVDSEKLRVALREKGIVVQKLYPVPGDRLYLRLSAAVYNTMEDFCELRDAVLDLVTKSSRL